MLFPTCYSRSLFRHEERYCACADRKLDRHSYLNVNKPRPNEEWCALKLEL